jgi:hypothetical protein
LRERHRTCAVAGFLAGLALLVARPAAAGPPFLTDDPEPVPFRHWEVYLATQWAASSHAATGTAPHAEVNFGALPNLQLHAIVPAAFTWARGVGAAYGPGDAELGAKLRFLAEGKRRPQIGIFPLLTLPTGSKERGLGAGGAGGLIPVWLQKSFGPFTTYGGGGLAFAPDGREAIFGWLLQRDLGAAITVGTEVFVDVPLDGRGVGLRLNLGAIVNLSDRHHLLVSAGPSFGGEDSLQAYLAYLLTT